MKYDIEQSSVDSYWNIAFGWSQLPYGAEWRREVQAWCRQTYGRGESDTEKQSPPRWRDNIVFGEICFRDRADVDWFLLKWS